MIISNLKSKRKANCQIKKENQKVKDDLAAEVKNKLELREKMTKDIEEAQSRLARQCIEVSSQSRLLVQMTALRLGMTHAERSLLEGFLCVWHRDTTGGNDESTASGWEEAVDAGMTYLLKTALSKSPRDVAQLNITLEMPQSIDDLKKKVAVVFDRLDKGGRLIVASEGSSSRK